MKNILLLGLLALVFIACEKNKKAPKAIQKYVFMGHTYDEEKDDAFDPRIYLMDFDLFDEIWLGGDLFNQTDQDLATLQKLDREMNVTAPHVYWTLGNHDCHNSNYSMTEQFLNNKVHYVDTHDGITRVVLNASIHAYLLPELSNRCDLLDHQYQMFQNVLDTITSASSHLVILAHQTPWGAIDVDLKKVAHYDAKTYQWSCQAGEHNFETVIYPKLVAVQQRGVEVIWLGGDWGGHSKRYQFVSPNSITFLACGLLQSYPDGKKTWPSMRQKDKDEFLIFTHNIKERELTWEFHILDTYIQNPANLK